MDKIIVVLLGFLTGSILSTATALQEAALYAVLIAGTAIIVCSCVKHEVARFFAIFIAAVMIGSCTVLLIAEWYENSIWIALRIFALLAITTTAILGVRSQNRQQNPQKRKEHKKEEEKKE